MGSDLTTSTAIDDEDAMHTLHKIVAINSRAQVVKIRFDVEIVFWFLEVPGLVHWR